MQSDPGQRQQGIWCKKYAPENSITLWRRMRAYVPQHKGDGTYVLLVTGKV